MLFPRRGKHAVDLHEGLEHTDDVLEILLVRRRNQPLQLHVQCRQLGTDRPQLCHGHARIQVGLLVALRRFSVQRRIPALKLRQWQFALCARFHKRIQ